MGGNDARNLEGQTIGIFDLFSRSAESDERRADTLRGEGRLVEAARLYGRAIEKARGRHGGASLYTHALQDKYAETLREASFAAAERARVAAERGDDRAAVSLGAEATRLAPTATDRQAVKAALEGRDRRRGRRTRGGRAVVRPEAPPSPPEPEPEPEPVGPQIIDETYVLASLPDPEDPVDVEFQDALDVLAPEDADRATGLGIDFRDGYLALLASRPDEALECLGRALRTHPDDPLILEMQADALVAANAPEARDALVALVDTYPERTSAALALAEMQAAGGDLHGARAVLERAADARLDTDDRRPEFRLAEVLGALGSTSEAYAILERLGGEMGAATAEMLTVAAAVARAADDADSESLYLRQAAALPDAPWTTHEALADFLAVHGGEPDEILKHLGAAERRLAAAPLTLGGDDDRRRGEARLLAKEVRALARARRLDLARDRFAELEEELAGAHDSADVAALRREIEEAERDEEEPVGLAPETEAEVPGAPPAPARPEPPREWLTQSTVLPIAEERDDNLAFTSDAGLAGGPDSELEEHSTVGEQAMREGVAELESEIRVEPPEHEST